MKLDDVCELLSIDGTHYFGVADDRIRHAGQVEIVVHESDPETARKMGLEFVVDLARQTVRAMRRAGQLQSPRPTPITVAEMVERFADTRSAELDILCEQYGGLIVNGFCAGNLQRYRERLRHCGRTREQIDAAATVVLQLLQRAAQAKLAPPAVYDRTASVVPMRRLRDEADEHDRQLGQLAARILAGG